jgi:superfamily II DNA/RNA helicase
MAARRPQTASSASNTKTSNTTATATATATTTFAELGVPGILIKALGEQGITAPFPIQAATLPDTLAGRDVLGRGRTGSGKTYAFALPVLARLAASRSPRQPGRPRALILAPTRELATQIAASIAPLADALSLRTTTVFGGVGAGPQISKLRAGVDILVACPGRLADHVRAGHARLDAVEVTVLDEADHMSDLGFLPVVRYLLEQTPQSGQRLLFSATLDAAVDVLVRRFLTKPAVHGVDSSLSPVAAMSHHVLHVAHNDRLPVLVDLVAAPGRTMVFTRTKRGAKMLTRRLIDAGVTAVELHGNLAQAARSRNLQAFSDGSARTLVATDIAARGIHVDDVALVIHADPPVEHKAYLHRSGRTARAGNAGTVVTLMTDDQVADVRQLVRQAGITPTTTKLHVGHPLLTKLAPGERSFVEPPEIPPTLEAPPRRQSRRGPTSLATTPHSRSQSAHSATARSATARSATARSGSARSGSAPSNSAAGTASSSTTNSTGTANPTSTANPSGAANPPRTVSQGWRQETRAGH